MKFEYKIIDPEEDGNPDSEYELNELGKDGWQLVGIDTLHVPYQRYYFVRHLTRNAADDAHCSCPHYYASDHCGYFKEGKCEHPRR